MFLKKLKLENFRNLENLELSFDKKINIFVGNNAQGKTNILESIYFLAITKSHRTRNELNLIKKDTLYTKVSALYLNDNEKPNRLSILLNEKGKKVEVNNMIQKKISNYLSNLNVIMFCPDDLDIVKGSPSIRRKFLNIELSQLNKVYVSKLKEYNLVLKQRNEYLKQKNNAKFNKNYFDILTKQIIEKNIEIVKFRYKFIDEINEFLEDIFNNIFESGVLKIKYKSFIEKEDLNKKEVNDLLFKKFERIFTNELLQKTTLLGCHKDDFQMYLNDLSVMDFCSQGQQRLTILSLKLAELEVFIKKNNIYPIVLLDDIFSELDENKKNNIIKYFNNKIQIFISTTEINDIKQSFKENSDIFVVENGKISKEE